jgi:Tol biopolymer transport system component
LFASSAEAGGPAPVAWSPDGEWIGYVLESSRASVPLPTDWFFDARLESGPTRRPAPSATVNPPRSELWASNVRTKVSVLLEDFPGRITPPGWSPDGRALVFGRLTAPGAGPGRYEVILLEGKSRRVLLSQQVEEWAFDSARMSRSAAAWSPDGRFIAVPVVHPAGLAIVRAENGRVIKSIESASLPAWSHDSTRLFYIGSGDQDRLECLEDNLGSSRHLAEVGQADSPPMVARDGQSVVVLGRTRLDRGVGSVAERVDLYRVNVEDGRKERIVPLLGGPQSEGRAIVATSLTQDRDGENYLSVVAMEGQLCQVSWYRTRERGVYKLFPVLDPSIPASDLNLSPAGGSLAVRLGPPGTASLPVVCELETMLLSPVIPDERTREAWIASLLDTAILLLREGRPKPIFEGRGIDRTVSLPIAGEIDTNSESIQRLRRIGRLGKTLCDDADRLPNDQRRDETRFIFDYLQENYTAALADLEVLDARDVSFDRRRQHLALRAQVYAGMGDLDRARGTLSYLKSIEPARARQVVEETSIGRQFTDDLPADAGWPDYALAQLDHLALTVARENEDDPTDPNNHRNPDAPLPGLGLDHPVFAPEPPLGDRLPPPPIKPGEVGRRFKIR